MSKLNLITSIQIYQDASPTNNPLQSTANWTNSAQGVEVSEPETRTLKVASQQSEVLFSGVVSTDNDNTTTFDLTKKPSVSNTYILSHNSNTAPNFRQDREISLGLDTEFTLSKTGALLTFTWSDGQQPDFTGLQFGDEVLIQGPFDISNRGTFKLLASTPSSFTVENYAGVAEVVTVQSVSDILIFSSLGVQIGQKVKLGASFAGYSQGVYEITSVKPNELEFNTSKFLPEELNVQAEIVVYKNSKAFVYIEYDKQCSLTINGVERKNLKPFQVGVKKANGIVMEVSDMYEATIKNESLETLSVLVISAE